MHFKQALSGYLRALESTRVLLAITTAVRLSAIGLLWVLVSRPGDMSGALWTYAFVSVATSATAWVALSHRQLARFVRPQWSVIAGLMRRASAIVFGNLSGALLTNGGVALLGITAAPPRSARPTWRCVCAWPDRRCCCRSSSSPLCVCLHWRARHRRRPCVWGAWPWPRCSVPAR
jgi:hypothetical protein